ncbi:hypothetical protein B0H14DRAFT_3897779 [Mycena olivaceomarginata]|nr:hypothetical protein B0H14DRAFT_3897779 [Mycena olivaceomarginata]
MWRGDEDIGVSGDVFVFFSSSAQGYEGGWEFFAEEGDAQWHTVASRWSGILRVLILDAGRWKPTPPHLDSTRSLAHLVSISSVHSCPFLLIPTCTLSSRAPPHLSPHRLCTLLRIPPSDFTHPRTQPTRPSSHPQSDLIRIKHPLDWNRNDSLARPNAAAASEPSTLSNFPPLPSVFIPPCFTHARPHAPTNSSSQTPPQPHPADSIQSSPQSPPLQIHSDASEPAPAST